MIASLDARARIKGTLTFSGRQTSVMMILALLFIPMANAGLKPVVSNPPDGHIQVQVKRHHNTEQSYLYLECLFLPANKSWGSDAVIDWSKPEGANESYQKSWKRRSVLHLLEAREEEKQLKLVGRYTCNVYCWSCGKKFSAWIDIIWVSANEHRELIENQPVTLHCPSGRDDEPVNDAMDERKERYLWKRVKDKREFDLNETRSFLQLNSVSYADNGTIYDCYKVTLKVEVLRKRFYISIQRPSIKATKIPLAPTSGNKSSDVTSQSSLFPTHVSPSSPFPTHVSPSSPFPTHVSPSSPLQSKTADKGRTVTTSVASPTDFPTDKDTKSNEHTKTQVVAGAVPSAVAVLAAIVAALAVAACRKKCQTSNDGAAAQDLKAVKTQLDNVEKGMHETKNMIEDEAEERRKDKEEAKRKQ
ncbi:uncharacterized protein [Oscarella lobularis]